MADDRNPFSGAREDALFRLAVARLEAARAGETAQAADVGDAELNPAAMDEAYRRTRIRVLAGAHRARRRLGTRRAFSRAAMAIASVLAVALVGGISALALSDGARTYLSKLLVSPEAEFTDFRFAPEATLPVPQPPADYTGDYFPAFLPSGFALQDVFESSAVYEAAGERYLFFDEYSFYTALGLDTEDADVTYGKVGGTDAMIVEKNGRTSVLWAYPDRFFLVMIDGTPDTALKVAESVVLIGN